MKTMIFDIDETICSSIKKDHKNYFIDNLIPNEGMIKKINQLYDKGHEIIFLTGRGAITGIDWEDETRMQLKTWGIKYHELKFIKKPLDYLYVDDKACSPQEFMEKY
ncbi:MAG: hypothetical protein IMZ52_08090 [Actinobacteria bacterium]|nr:hypothetical protein [Actinomycetota bacterium]MBE3114625.1 hypothetical protein [Actinomycetota bacterium]